FHKLGLDKKLKNKVRWAWWSGEELGLLGSHHYVEDLYANDPEALKKIKISLDWDMIGSPNYIRGIYNGHEAQNPDLRGPSGRIQDLLAEWFHSHDLATTWVEFDGRSDYGPFLNRGIPCGGVFTGAEVIKTEEQRDVFGGMANVAFDPCYHQHCDSLGNVWGPGLDVLEQNARALAY
ncbi:Zn-dependent exopeptidase, partial [Caulochytrium protostelioides]